MTARRPPRWALVRVCAALEAQQLSTETRADVALLARRLGLSRGLTAACLRAATAAAHAGAAPRTASTPADASSAA